MDDEFIPDTVETSRHADGKRIKLSFGRDDGERREIVLLRSWLPQLLNKIRGEIAPSSAVQIDRDSLRPGQDFSLQGWECQRSPSGGARMKLYIDLPDQGRVVTIPILLNSQEVRQMIEHLETA